MRRAAAVVFPLRGLQQMPRILIGVVVRRAQPRWDSRACAALPSTTAVAALPRNPRRVKSDGIVSSFQINTVELHHDSADCIASPGGTATFSVYGYFCRSNKGSS